MRGWTARILRRVWNLGGRRSLANTPLRRLKPDSVILDLPEFRLEVPTRFIPHYAHGTYEPITQKSFRSHLAPGMIVLDVGAHVGTFSLVASRLVGPAGHVHAIEPFDENLNYLRRNLRRNGASNVTVHPVAAGDEDRTRTFHVTGSSDSHGFFNHPNTPTVRTIEVHETRLDDVVSGRVNAAKLDVEGAELLVLDGMKRILDENRDIILWVEWMPACMKNAGFDPADLPSRLQKLGFKSIEVLDDRREASLPLKEVLAQVRSGALPNDWYANLLATKRA